VSTTLTDLSPQTDPLHQFATDLPFYSGVNLRIRTKAGTLLPLRLNFAQRVLHDHVTRQREATGRVRIICLKARQKGISTYVAARFFRRVHLWPNVLGMVIADLKKRSGELFQIYDRYHRNLPEDLRPGVRYTSKLELAFDHDSKLMVETAKDTDAGRGLTLQLVHGSEVASWENAEDVVLALFQAVPSDGSEIFLESTAKGVGNWFHRFWDAAVAGENGYIPVFLPWWIHEEYRVEVTDSERGEILASTDPFERLALDEGIDWDPPGGIVPEALDSGARWIEGKWLLSPEQLAWRRRTIADQFGGDERSFRQEYPSTAREAFLVSGNCFFDEEALLELEQSQRLPTWRGNLVRAGHGFMPRPAERGYLRVWEPPLPDGHYVVGADTAEGRLVAARDTTFSDPEGERGGRDFNSASVIRLGYWRVVKEDGKPRKEWVRPALAARLHGRMAPEVFADGLDLLGRYYSCPRKPHREPSLLGVERNHSSGQTVLRRLRDVRRYPALFYHRLMNRRTSQRSEYLGWMTSGETRMPMLDEWAQAIREKAIDYPEAEGIRESFTFVRGEDGRPEAQEGCHDDRVISDAIAWQMATHHHTAEPAGNLPEPEVQDTPTGL
jgi:hypothetical protein